MLLARTHHANQRRGAILLIVLTLLALFAVIGLSFVLFAESEAAAARVRREKREHDDTPPATRPIANAFLGRVIYPTAPSGYDLLNAIRGYDMATMVYGNNPAGANTTPYNGIGTVAEDHSTNPLAAPIAITDRRQVVNYSWQYNRATPANSRIFHPEHLGVHATTTYPPVVMPGSVPAAYVARNAPYTYPDRNNIYVAMNDPRSGIILRQSYVSPHFGGLFQGNPNWTNAAGRYMSIRPRPADHIYDSNDGRGSVTDFPYPPTNPDGATTGDLQNIRFNNQQQRNDSVWTYAGLPVQTWRGRNIVPLVAPLILPLDGRVNVNMAGNSAPPTPGAPTMPPTPPNPPIPATSTHGFGPWEISLKNLIDPTTPYPSDDATRMINHRTGSGTTPSPRGSNVISRPFAVSSTQSYGTVNWEAGTTAGPMAMPSLFQSDPTYPTGFDSSTSGNIEGNSHPAMFNPFTWTTQRFSNTAAVLFPHTDLRRAAAKYTGKANEYLDPFFGFGANRLKGVGFSGSNQLRWLLTTHSNSRATPGLQPNYADYTTSTLAYNGVSLQSVPQPLVTPLTPGASSDFANANTIRSALAQLGSVDVNRPLVDYRPTATGPLSNTNAGNSINAANDRQTLARDIFARLILATGAKANITSTTMTLPQPAGMGSYGLIAAGDTNQQQYDALRFLAQLAANIVDYIDNDDVNTTFVWNPDPGTAISLHTPDISSLASSNNFQPGVLADRVVYGTEKPRVLLNEVYAEVANNTNDRNNNVAARPFDVRFFIELINPTNAGTDTTAPLGNNTANLRALDTVTGLPLYSIYNIQIFDPPSGGGNAVRNSLYLPTAAIANPMGIVNTAMGTPAAPKLSMNFTNVTVPGPMLAANANSIEPNTGTAAVTGFRLLTPTNVPTTSNGVDLHLNTAAAPYNGVIQSTRLSYTMPVQTPPNITTNTVDLLRDHGVVLRRLANPYLPPNLDPNVVTATTPYNPYITVDSVTGVDAQDGIKVGSMNGPNGLRPMQPDITNRNTSGRQVPHYGYHTGPGMMAASFWQNQNAGMMAFGQTFLNHNSNFTQAAAWLPHMDRSLVNTTELIHVSGVKPHELTYRFASNPAATQTNQHTAFVAGGTTPLYRALELLTTKPWTLGVPHQGRTAGKININMIWSPDVLAALLDANASNNFTATEVNNLFGSVLFGNAAHSRTKNANGFPGTTFDEGGAAATADRPFKPFGTANYVPPTLPLPVGATGLLPGGSGLEDTLLRTDTTTGRPAMYYTSATATQPYQQAEMLRKMYNNITTTSDTYLVVMTVGFFEVRNNGPYSLTNPPVLGKEVFDEIPGDIRGKFVAIVDRSMIAADAPGGTNQANNLYMTSLNESPYTLPMQPTHLRFLAQGQRVDTTTGNPVAIQLYYEGRFIEVSAGSTLVLGSGPGQEVVNVTALGGFQPNGAPALAFDAATGIATVQLSAAPVGNHPGGTMLSNAYPGNPGQQNFDVSFPRYKGVVPHFEQIEIAK